MTEAITHCDEALSAVQEHSRILTVASFAGAAIAAAGVYAAYKTGTDATQMEAFAEASAVSGGAMVSSLCGRELLRDRKRVHDIETAREMAIKQDIVESSDSTQKLRAQTTSLLGKVKYREDLKALNKRIANAHEQARFNIEFNNSLR